MYQWNVSFFSLGVLAQEILQSDYDAKGSSYIPASYVKYLEGAGARVVPIRYTHYIIWFVTQSDDDYT